MLLIIFPNFRLICPYFDNYNFWRCITHNIYHPHRVFLAGYDWFEGKILYLNTKIRTYHVLFAYKTMSQLKILMTWTLFYCKVSSKLVHSVSSIDHLCQVSFIWSISQPWSFFSSLVVFIKKKVYRKATHN